MRRWQFILLVVSCVTMGVGLGVMFGRATWYIAYTMGGVNARAEHMIETQYFKDQVQAGSREFRLGEYTFRVLDRRQKVVGVQPAPKPMGGRE